jgi:predicted acyl esterase
MLAGRYRFGVHLRTSISARVLALAATLLATVGTGVATPATSAASALAPAASMVTPSTSFPPLPAPTYKTVARDISVAMDDGVHLGATVTFPSLDGKNPAPGRFPVIFSMTPYGRETLCSCGDQTLYPSRGIISAAVDTRGTGGSEGNLNQNYFSPREARDGYALTEYFGTQLYSTGKVGMQGGSYVGITQYLTAEQQPPHLAAIAPQVALADVYRDAFTHGGIPNIFFDAQYLAVQGGPGLLGPGGPSQLDMTVRAKVEQLLGTPIAFDYIAHPNDDAFYRDRSPYYHADKIKVPVLIIDGWRDGFIRGATEMYGILSKRKGVETRMEIDPCTHKGCGGEFAPTTNPPGRDDEAAVQFEFMRHHLLGESVPARPNVRYYVQSLDRYAASSTWPPSQAATTKLSLQRGALANKASGASTASYITNPLEGLSTPLGDYGTVAASPYLPLDQRLATGQGITWRTGVLSSSMTLAGPTQLHLVASSSANDTDWMAKLADVAPDGTETLISEGFLRASHRALDAKRSTTASPYHTHTDPTPITPGRLYAYDIGIWPTAYTLAAGHRLQLRLTSIDLPTHAPMSIQLDRNALGATTLDVTPLPPARNTVREGEAGSWLVVTTTD